MQRGPSAANSYLVTLAVAAFVFSIILFGIGISGASQPHDKAMCGNVEMSTDEVCETSSYRSGTLSTETYEQRQQRQNANRTSAPGFFVAAFALAALGSVFIVMYRAKRRGD